MTLADWARNGWLIPHEPSLEEIANLLGSGYRAEKNLGHYRTLQALPLILGKIHSSNTDYLDACRRKRNETEYDIAGTVSPGEVKELLEFCSELRTEVLIWLRRHHRDLIP